MKNNFKIDILKTVLFSLFLVVFLYGIDAKAQVTLCSVGQQVGLVADSYSVYVGSATNIYWSSEKVSPCTVTGNGQTWSGTSGSASTGAINSNTDFTLSCNYNINGCNLCYPGPCSKTITITALPIPVKPSIDLKITPSKVDSNGTAEITWSIKEAELKNCSNSSTLGNWNMTSLSGTQEIQNISQSQTFSISCSNSYGTTNASTSVSVNTRLFALPISVARGGSSLLSWISSLGSVCTLTNNAGYSYTGEATDHNLVYGVGAYTLSCKAKDEKSSTAKISIYRKNGLRCTK